MTNKIEAVGHTPGPWVLDCENLPHGPKPTLITYVGVPIAKAIDNYANARLIAAAPELLEALEEAFMALGRAGGNMITSPIRAEWEKARAAIAKAKGAA